MVDREGVASVRDLHDLRHGGVAPLPLVGGVRDRPRHRVVLLALDDQQGAAVGVLRVHLRLRPRVEVRVAHLHERDPGAGDVESVVELLRLLLVQRVRPAVLELVERERDRAAARARIDQERARRPEHGGRQRQNATEDPGVDRHRGRREAPAREHLRQQAPGRVPYDGWLPVQGIDDLGGVIGDLLQGLLGENVGVRPGLLNRFRIARPVRRQRRVAGLLEKVRPVGPAARQQPEAMDEDDRRVVRGVGRLDLPVLPLGNRRHDEIPSGRVKATRPYRGDGIGKGSGRVEPAGFEPPRHHHAVRRPDSLALAVTAASPRHDRCGRRAGGASGVHHRRVSAKPRTPSGLRRRLPERGSRWTRCCR